MSSINIVFCLFFSVFSLAIGRRVTSSSSWPEKETEWNSAPLREFWWTPRGWCPVSRIRLAWLQFYNLYVFACVFFFVFFCLCVCRGNFLMVNNGPLWLMSPRSAWFLLMNLCVFVFCFFVVVRCVCAVCVILCMCMCLCVFVCVYVYVYVCMCKCMCLCVCVCVYV